MIFSHALKFILLEEKACMELFHHRPGKDILEGIHHESLDSTSNTTAIDCQKLCQRVKHCQYFTWEGSTSMNGSCWIKTEKPDKKYYSLRAVSGPKNCPGKGSVL